MKVKNRFCIKFSFILLILPFYSCIDNNYYKEIEKNKERAMIAILKGDEELFNSSSDWFLGNSSSGSFIYFTNAMSIKQNHYFAYYETFYIYSTSYDGIEGDKESPFYNFLLYNLAKAYELGYDVTEDVIGNDTITKDNIKSSKYYFKKAFPKNRR